jgi:tyrosine-protein phosphatase SIW14
MVRSITSIPFRAAIVVASFGIVTLLGTRAQTTAISPVRSETNPGASNAPAEKLRLAGIPNAGKISDVLLRGAQPSEKGFAQLKKLGVTTIVNLRDESREVVWERKVTESLGLRYVNIPVRGWSPPFDNQVAQFLKLFHDTAGQRIFVHCYYGDDRTGVMVATYRIAQQDWTADQAVKEMYFFGFHHSLYPNMKSYVRRFPANFANESVFSALRATHAPSAEAKKP